MKQPKITVTIDVTKIPRERIIERQAKDKEGNTYTAKEVKIDVVPFKPKDYFTIANGDTWELVKTHFAVMSPSKEERAAKVNLPFVGDGVQFLDKSPGNAHQEYNSQPSDDFAENIPF